jgi:hypothetical protein
VESGQESKTPSEESSTNLPKSDNITNQKLLEAVDSVDAFDKMYMVSVIEIIFMMNMGIDYLVIIPFTNYSSFILLLGS